MTDAAELVKLVASLRQQAKNWGHPDGLDARAADAIERLAAQQDVKHDKHSGPCPTCGFQILPPKVRPSEPIEDDLRDVEPGRGSQ